MQDGTEKPIAYACTILLKAERHYSLVDKEAIDFVNEVKKSHTYLYVKKQITLLADHKP